MARKSHNSLGTWLLTLLTLLSLGAWSAEPAPQGPEDAGAKPGAAALDELFEQQLGTSSSLAPLTHRALVLPPRWEPLAKELIDDVHMVCSLDKRTCKAALDLPIVEVVLREVDGERLAKIVEPRGKPPKLTREQRVVIDAVFAHLQDVGRKLLQALAAEDVQAQIEAIARARAVHSILVDLLPNADFIPTDPLAVLPRPYLEALEQAMSSRNMQLERWAVERPVDMFVVERELNAEFKLRVRDAIVSHDPGLHRKARDALGDDDEARIHGHLATLDVAHQHFVELETRRVIAARPEFELAFEANQVLSIPSASTISSRAMVAFVHYHAQPVESIRQAATLRAAHARYEGTLDFHEWLAANMSTRDLGVVRQVTDPDFYGPNTVEWDGIVFEQGWLHEEVQYEIRRRKWREGGTHDVLGASFDEHDPAYRAWLYEYARMLNRTHHPELRDEVQNIVADFMADKKREFEATLRLVAASRDRVFADDLNKMSNAAIRSARRLVDLNEEFSAAGFETGVFNRDLIVKLQREVSTNPDHWRPITYDSIERLSSPKFDNDMRIFEASRRKGMKRYEVALRRVISTSERTVYMRLEQPSQSERPPFGLGLDVGEVMRVEVGLGRLGGAAEKPTCGCLLPIVPTRLVPPPNIAPGGLIKPQVNRMLHQHNTMSTPLAGGFRQPTVTTVRIGVF